MYRTIADFLADWKAESASTARIMDALTDPSLAQRVTPEDRSLGWTAWHVVTTMAEMPGFIGFKLDAVDAKAPMPASAAAIAAAYRAGAADLAELIRDQWTDETLQVEDNLFGEVWNRGTTLAAIIAHEIHHRGQMTVLMRQAGLRVPGIYGPAREDWAAMGVKAPAIY